MARTNSRPDVIYVRDLTDQDKDNFEALLNHFGITSNSEAVLRVLAKYFPLLKQNKDQEEEIKKLQNTIKLKDKKLITLAEQKKEMLKQIGNIEETLKNTAEFIKEL